VLSPFVQVVPVLPGNKIVGWRWRERAKKRDKETERDITADILYKAFPLRIMVVFNHSLDI
jgi:hypothetical protein